MGLYNKRQFTNRGHLPKRYNKFIKKNKVILVYPVPSLDYDLRKRMMNEVPKSTFKASEYLKENPYTTRTINTLKIIKK